MSRIAVFAGFLVGCAPAITETWAVGPATAIENTTFAQVRVTVGEGSDDVVVSCPALAMERLSIEVVEDTLQIRQDDLPIPLLSLGPCLVDVEVDALTSAVSRGSGRMEVWGPATLMEVRNSGSAGMFIESQTSEGLEIHNAGSGRVSIDDLDVGELFVDGSGSGGILLDGDADVLDLSLSGSGGVRSPGLVAADATVSLSGSGGVELTVLDHVEVRASGSGGVVIHGDPDSRDVDTSGSGRVRFVE